MDNGERRQALPNEACLDDLMVPASNIIGVDKPVRVARRWFETGAVRSLIVIDGSRPVGVLGTWEVRKADPGEPVWRYMHSQIPLLNDSLPVSAARTLLRDVPNDIDRLPVVDGSGQLVGEVPREQLSARDESEVVRCGSHIRLERADGAVTHRWLGRGHPVLSIDGEELGTVARLCLLAGTPVAFIVRHGMLSRQQTRVPLALIADLSREAVTLTVDRAAFELLQEIEHVSASVQSSTALTSTEGRSVLDSRQERTMTDKQTQAAMQVDMEVYSADAGHVGRVKALREADFLVDRQRRRDIYLPYDVVAQVLEGEWRVDLLLSEVALLSAEWEHPTVVAIAGNGDSGGQARQRSVPAVGDLMRSPDNVVGADEPVRATLPQFELETARSLIAVAADEPRGILPRQRVTALSETELDQPVHQFLTRVPLLSAGTSLESARAELEDLDFAADRLPVVGADGKLVGVIDRVELDHQARTTAVERGLVIIDAEAGATAEVAAGMRVLGPDREHLGTVDEVFIEEDRVTALSVAHGLFGRRHKQVAAEHVNRITDADVQLDFGKMEFKQLADVEQPSVAS